MYCEKATKFCEISTLLFFYVVPVKSKLEISQNFVAFSENMNFNGHKYNCTSRLITTESAQSSKSKDLSLLHSGPEDIFEVLRTKTFKS